MFWKMLLGFFFLFFGISQAILIGWWNPFEPYTETVEAIIFVCWTAMSGLCFNSAWK